MRERTQAVSILTPLLIRLLDEAAQLSCRTSRVEPLRVDMMAQGQRRWQMDVVWPRPQRPQQQCHQEQHQERSSRADSAALQLRAVIHPGTGKGELRRAHEWLAQHGWREVQAVPSRSPAYHRNGDGDGEAGERAHTYVLDVGAVAVAPAPALGVVTCAKGLVTAAAIARRVLAFFVGVGGLQYDTMGDVQLHPARERYSVYDS